MRTFSKAMASSWLQRVRALTAACSNGSPSTDARHRWTVVLTAKHPVNTHSLVVELDSIIKHEAVYRRILTRTGDPHAMKQALASVQLAPEVTLRLTLCASAGPTPASSMPCATCCTSLPSTHRIWPGPQCNHPGGACNCAAGNVDHLAWHHQAGS